LEGRPPPGVGVHCSAFRARARSSTVAARPHVPRLDPLPSEEDSGATPGKGALLDTLRNLTPGRQKSLGTTRVPLWAAAVGPVSRTTHPEGRTPKHQVARQRVPGSASSAYSALRLLRSFRYRSPADHKGGVRRRCRGCEAVFRLDPPEGGQRVRGLYPLSRERTHLLDGRPNPGSRRRQTQRR